jgi:hypothetical protein
MTRQLVVRYLWVDALRIVHDDDRLKSNEIDRMGNIYVNAILTVSASSPTSAAEGFLCTVEAPKGCELLFLTPNGKFARVPAVSSKEDN